MKRMLAFAVPLALVASAALAKDVPFTFTNSTSTPVTEFYISLPDSDAWGPNLVTSPIATGASGPATLTGVDTCVFDIKTVFADATSTEDRAFDLCENPDFNIEEE